MLLVDGNWAEWSEWSTCSKTCKEGQQSRTRECNSPAPQYGGKVCEGDSNQTQVCNGDVPCPGTVRLFITSQDYTLFWTSIINLLSTLILVNKK